MKIPSFTTDHTFFIIILLTIIIAEEIGKERAKYKAMAADIEYAEVAGY